MALRCTRIWWVRPVWIATWTSVSIGPNFRARTILVTASRLRRARADIFLRLTGSRPIGRVDAPARLHLAPYQRDVFLLDLTVVELARQALVSGIVFGDDHQTRRPAIQPVDDARPAFAADAAQVVHVVQERVDERPAGMTGRRVHDHPRRLVHDDQVSILVNDGQRQRFGARLGIDGVWNVHRDGLAGLHGQVGLCFAPVDAHVSVLDEPLDVRARLPREHRNEKYVQAGARAVGGHRERGVHAAFLRERWPGAGAARRPR